jgi:hypothetical protein
MTDRLNDPVPPSAYPSFQPMTGPPPPMPSAWTCTALLHPFSPPASINPQPDNPFFQLCVANIVCMQGQFLSAQIAGCTFGTWWYMITPSGTQLSTDQGGTWTNVDMGWSLPSNWFGNQSPNAACAGTSPLNWMAAQNVDWWKVPVPIPGSQAPAATWMWFDSASQAPVRMMFGYGPPSPTMGDPTQLALFQMYSFTYFPAFTALQSVSQPTGWTNPSFPGFAVGNPNGYKKFVWNSNFGMTAFMTPVNENFNPLPTRVLYVWKPDLEYAVATDRAQDTLMLQYAYNPGDLRTQEALLFGEAPKGVTPPPGADLAFLIKEFHSPLIECSQFPYPQEPPDWVSIPAVEGTIQATIADNAVLCPGVTVAVYSVLFPPAKNYPQGTYLWTWYAPAPGGDGTQSRPVTFMQSQSGVGVGTSLALADYYYYEEFGQPIDPSNFAVPAACSGQTAGQAREKGALRFRLP